MSAYTLIYIIERIAMYAALTAVIGSIVIRIVNSPLFILLLTKIKHKLKSYFYDDV